MNTQQFREDIIEYGDKLFMNSASSSLVVKSVLEKISDYLQVEARHGGYWTNEKYAPELDLFYKEAAQLLHAEAHQIAIVQSATEGYIKALSSIPFQKDDVLLTTEVDYNSNFIQFISLKKRFGIKIIIAQHLEKSILVGYLTLIIFVCYCVLELHGNVNTHHILALLLKHLSHFSVVL